MYKTKPINKLLIANRGEIAIRIIKTCQKLGIKTVAIYSDADSYAPFVRMADSAYYLGESLVAKSYLNIPKIVDIVKQSGADAVHPGYGFLSENAEFARIINEETEAVFIGPTHEAILAMGDKIASKETAQLAKVNIIQGSGEALEDVNHAITASRSLGFPVILKASAGGGGKGIRIIHKEEDLAQAFVSVTNESQKNFGDSRIFVERYIENPRHIEIQIIADTHGNIVCLGERECSIQRNNQKIIEESPSAFIDEATRQKMYKQSVSLVKKVSYISAGTVEYVVDKNKNFFFLEMNTRLQVEHPVTEFVTGLDLVEIMINIAEGKPLPVTQKTLKLTGHAIESRVCSEEPSRGFMPSTGRILTYIEPNINDFEKNIRIDSGVRAGFFITPYYDAMIAKLISYAPTREKAIKQSIQALNQYVIEGVDVNILFLQNIQKHPNFISGDTTTHFIKDNFGDSFSYEQCEIDEDCLKVFAFASLALYTKTNKKLWSSSDSNFKSGRKNNDKRTSKTYVMFVSGIERDIELKGVDGGHYSVVFDGKPCSFYCSYKIGARAMKISINDISEDAHLQVIENVFSSFYLAYNGVKKKILFRNSLTASLDKICQNKKTNSAALNNLESPIAGLVTAIHASVNETIRTNMSIITIEAMKMENVITVTSDAIIKAINCKVGDVVSVGEKLVEFTPVELS